MDLLHKLDQLELAALSAPTVDRLDGISDDLADALDAAGPADMQRIDPAYRDVIKAIETRYEQLGG